MRDHNHPLYILFTAAFSIIASLSQASASEIPFEARCNSFGLAPAQSGSISLEENFKKWEVLSKVPNPSEDTCSMRIQTDAKIVLGKSSLLTKLAGWVLVKGTSCNISQNSDLTHRWNNKSNFFTGEGVDSISGGKMLLAISLEAESVSALEILPSVEGIKRGDDIGCTIKKETAQ